MSDYNNISTLEEALAHAAHHGVSLTPDQLAQAHAAMREHQQQLENADLIESTHTGLRAFVERFNRFYPRFLQALIGTGDVLITMTQTILIAFGVPLVLLMLLVVEQQRVFHGVSLFEMHEALAAFSATSLVILNLILELLISWTEHRANWTEPPKNEFSFRLFSQRMSYLLGRSTDWQPRPKSPALRFRIVLRIVTFAILSLALAGSMRAVIEQTSGTWLDALRTVLLDSTLLQAATWLGGLMFAVAAVLSAQALSQYVANKVIEVVAIMQSTLPDKSRLIAEATGLVGAAFVMARLKETQQARRQNRAVSAAAEMPEIPSGRLAVRSNSSGTFQEFQKHPGTPGTAVSGVSGTFQEFQKLTPTEEKAVKWLKEHPDMDGLTANKAAERAGVSPATMSRARKKM
jgi:hypothetical protein